MIGHAALAARLKGLGVNLAQPGFYDDEAFIAHEQIDPFFLNEYARYVASRPLDEDYCRAARRDITVIADVLNAELVSDGRLGACIDVGMMFSRILEREGYWNFQVNGSLTIEFPEHSHIPPKYFWSFDIVDRPFAAAHSWLVAPPFVIADIAVRQQPYTEGAQLLPPIVLVEDAPTAVPRLSDMFSPEYEAAMCARGVTAEDLIEKCAPEWLTFGPDFPPVVVKAAGVTLRYTPVGIGAPDGPFEEMTGWRMNGRLGTEVYAETIRPALASARI